jgi:cholesterol transport system auxiliary component
MTTSLPILRKATATLTGLGLGTLLAALLTFLSSCSILPTPQTLAIYQLPPPSIAAAAKTDQLPQLPLTLHISKPDSSRVTDTQRVLILRQDNRISAYKGARWSDSPPVLLRNQLTSAFRADGRLSIVGDKNVNQKRDLELSGELYSFHVEYVGGKPAAVIRFYAVLAQPTRNRVIASRSFEIRQPVEGNGMPEVVASFGKGADDLARQIIDWAIQHGGAIQADQADAAASAGKTNPPEAKP